MIGKWMIAILLACQKIKIQLFFKRKSEKYVFENNKRNQSKKVTNTIDVKIF